MRIILIFLSMIPLAMATTSSNRSWIAVNTFGQVTDSVEFQLFAEQRYNLDLGETAQSVFLLGPHYRINEKHRVGLLYGDFHAAAGVEHRIVLEHFHNITELGSFSFVARTRLEGRYRENRPDDSLRLRYMLSFLEQGKKPYRLFFWTEPFLNLQDHVWTGNRTLERVRSFLGARIKVFKTSLDVGYMHEYIPRSTGDSVEHILSVVYHI